MKEMGSMMAVAEGVPEVAPRWIIGHVDTHGCVPIYWLGLHDRDYTDYRIPVDAIEVAWRYVGHLDVGGSLAARNRHKLDGVLTGIQATARPRPESTLDEGEHGVPVGLPGMRLIENIRAPRQVKGVTVGVPCCASCGDPDDVELGRIDGSHWFFRCASCGRAWTAEDPDVCGACLGSGVIEFAVPGSRPIDTATCDVCNGAGR